MVDVEPKHVEHVWRYDTFDSRENADKAKRGIAGKFPDVSFEIDSDPAVIARITGRSPQENEVAIHAAAPPEEWPLIMRAWVESLKRTPNQ